MPKIKIPTRREIENRKVVSQKEWLVARKKLLLKEKKFSKLPDALNLQRRKLPWVKTEKGIRFRRAGGQGDTCRLILRQEPAPHLSLHVRTGLERRLRTLLVLGRPFR